MEHSKELSLLSDALHSDNIQEAVNGNSRRILKERVNSMDFYDIILQEKLKEIISVLNFPLKIQLKELPLSKEVQTEKFEFLKYIKCIILGLLGVILTVLPFWYVSLIGGIFLFITGIALKSAFSPKQEQPVASLVCTSTESDLMQSIDAIYEKLQVLFNHNQLEGRHKDVLIWLQRLFSDDDDGKYRVEFLKLMSVLGYEFVEYSDDISDNFEVSDANVSEIVTSKYAVRNIKTGRFVLPGVVVFPKKEK